MSESRQVRRARERALRKEAKKKSKAIEKAVARMPEKCDECSAPFDKLKSKHLDKWRIAVYDDGRINLVCPDCVPEEVKNVDAQTG